MTKAALLTIGDEILLGQILDTNAKFIAETLVANGIDLVAKLTVGDTDASIWGALTFCFENADILIVTGGLGPTRDDLTKGILARWFKSELRLHPQALSHIEDLLRRRGREMNELIKLQAEQPVKSEYLKNEVGTAPGMWFSENNKICVALPGVPYEMKQILLDEVMPRLRKRLQLDAIVHQFIRTVGAPETLLAQRITDWEDDLPPYLKLAYLPGGGQVKLRLTARGSNEFELRNELARQTEMVLPLISEYVYATEDVELETIVGRLLLEKGLQIRLHDEITQGVLFQKFVGFPEIQKMLISEARYDSKDTSLAQISIVSYDNGLQKVSVSIGSDIQKMEIRPFPYPEVNRNIVSLAALNLLRKMILGISASA